MKKLVVNRNFNDNYMYRWFQRLVQHDRNDVIENSSYVYRTHSYYYRGWYEKEEYSQISYYLTQYSDLSSIDNSVDVQAQLDNYNHHAQDASHMAIFNHVAPIVMVSETTLTVIDRINSYIKQGIIYDDDHFNYNQENVDSSGLTPLRVVFPMFFNTLYSKETSARYNLLQRLVNCGMITESERDIMHELYFPMDEYSMNSISTNVENDVYTMNSNDVMKLQKPYRAESNTWNEQMYLVFVNYNTENYNDSRDSSRGGMWRQTFYDGNGNPYYHHHAVHDAGGGRLYKPYTSFYSKENNRDIVQTVYMAFSLGLEGSNRDIKFDHLDKIDYIDNFELRFMLPKEIK